MKRHRRWRRLRDGFLIGVAALGIVLLLRDSGLMTAAEHRAFDARMRWTADPARADSSIVFVTIDDNSLEALRNDLGRWPWPRDVYGAILQYLAAGDARLVAFDILFPEADLSNPEGDSFFAEVMEETGIAVLPFTLTAGDRDQAARWEAARGIDTRERDRRLSASSVGAAPPDVERPYAYVEPPLAPFAEAARGLGAVVWNPDPDGVTRSEHLTYGFRGRLYPSLPLAAAGIVAPDRFGGEISMSPDALRAADARIPLDDGRMVVRWHGSYLASGASTYTIYPAFHILNSFEQIRTGRAPDVPLDAFRDKIVFVGVSAAGAYDLRTTPLRPHDPGIIVHATVLDNLLAGDPLRRPSRHAETAALIATTIAAGVLTAGLGSAVLASAAFLLLQLLIAGTAYLLFRDGVWVAMAAPMSAVTLAFGGALAANWMLEGRERRRVRDLFGRYVAPEYVRRLADDFETIELGGERVPLTLLFSDIRGFTRMSEGLPAETVVEILNEYLDRMAEVVHRHGGTLDKFIGDAVMAFWGAPLPHPDHAERAVRAALEMRSELAALNEDWKKRGIPATFRIGIGLHTGEAVVGNIGSRSRKVDYTAIGDTVNLASRIESMTKDRGVDILASDVTRQSAGEGYLFEPLGQVEVRGREAPITIHYLAGTEETASHPAIPTHEARKS